MKDFFALFQIPWEGHFPLALALGLALALIPCPFATPAPTWASTPAPGRHTVTYTVMNFGPYRLNVTLDGAHVRGSPFNLTVAPVRHPSPQLPH